MNVDGLLDWLHSHTVAFRLSVMWGGVGLSTWLEAHEDIIRISVLLLTGLYTVLQLVFLLRDKLRKRSRYVPSTAPGDLEDPQEHHRGK